MKKIWLFIIFSLYFITQGHSQIWKPVKNRFQATYIIYITDNKRIADIIAYQVDKEYEAIKPGLIYLAPIWYSRGVKVFFTNDRSSADLFVYWTKDKKEVIWK
jgi:hypothetical protein